jgi:hypothetical protein
MRLQRVEPLDVLRKPIIDLLLYEVILLVWKAESVYVCRITFRQLFHKQRLFLRLLLIIIYLVFVFQVCLAGDEAFSDHQST